MNFLHPLSSLTWTCRLALVTLLGLGGLSASAVDPSGVWTFTVQSGGQTAEGAEGGGRQMESTLTLQWSNQRLTGKIKNRIGEVALTETAFDGETVKFTVERTFGRFLRKKTFTTHYEGTVTDAAIEGTISGTGRDEKPVSLPWHATRSP